MTAFTVISNALVAVGAKPFATTMQAFRDNVIAAFEGDATAVAAGVQLRRAALLDAAINRVKLDTATASQAWSTTSGGGDLNIAMNPYSFFPAHNNTSGVATLSIGNTGTNADLPRARVQIGGVGSGTFYWRYINA